MAGDLTRFKSTLVYGSEAPAAAILSDLQEVREFDQQSEARLSKYKYLTAGSVVLFGISIALVVVTHRQAWIALGIVAALALVVAIVLWVRGAKFDLANRRYELLGELVQLLSRDMAQDAPLTVALDLAAPNDARKKTGTGEAGPWKVTYFVDPWLRVGGRFADGTSFQIALVEKHQHRGKWKRSSSGKHKYKTKTKSATQASVRLFPKGKRYENLPKVVDQAANSVRLPPWLGVKNLAATTDELSLTAVTTEPWGVRRKDPKTVYDGVEMVATMLLSLYQVINSSTAVS